VGIDTTLGEGDRGIGGLQGRRFDPEGVPEGVEKLLPVVVLSRAASNVAIVGKSPFDGIIPWYLSDRYSKVTKTVPLRMVTTFSVARAFCDH
jgi:hypothetical protein